VGGVWAVGFQAVGLLGENGGVNWSGLMQMAEWSDVMQAMRCLCACALLTWRAVLLCIQDSS
jgi:hypothetical protein